MWLAGGLDVISIYDAPLVDDEMPSLLEDPKVLRRQGFASTATGIEECAKDRLEDPQTAQIMAGGQDSTDFVGDIKTVLGKDCQVKRAKVEMLARRWRLRKPQHFARSDVQKGHEEVPSQDLEAAPKPL